MIQSSTCTNCGTEFTYKTSDKSGKYCTRQCWKDDLAKRSGSKLIVTKYGNRRAVYPFACVICGKTAYARSSVITKHCSQQCKAVTLGRKAKYKSVIVNGKRRMVYPITCLSCGASKDACRKSAKYCSSKCQLTFEYEQGTRDGAATTAKAHAAIMEQGFPERRGKKIPHLHNPTVYAKVSVTKTGRPVPKLQGANNPRWRGGKNQTLWKSVEYQTWRKSVMRRDNFTCVLCGDNKGGNLEADHIKPRMLYPELTFDLSNGRTLCKTCHKATPTHGQKVRNLYAIRSSLIIATLVSL
jgi:endogenous inhibitor of DNA gyrase (YacG/DUF329 family)